MPEQESVSPHRIDPPVDLFDDDPSPAVGKNPKKASGWKFTIGALLGVAMFAGVLFALGVRLEHQDLTPPAASPEEVARQALAEQATRIKNSALQLAKTEPGNESLREISDAAASYADALGGVWIPWPDGAPSGYTNPPVATAAAENSNAAALMEELLDFSQATLVRADAVTPDQARTLGAMALGSQFLAMNLAEAESLPGAPTCGEANVETAGHAANQPAVLETSDAARQWLETDAANLPADARAAELDRIDTLTAFEEVILSSGTADSRSAFAAYPTLAEGETYTYRGLQILTSQLLDSAAQIDGEQRLAVLSFACSLHHDTAERSATLAELLP